MYEVDLTKTCTVVSVQMGMTGDHPASDDVVAGLLARGHELLARAAQRADVSWERMSAVGVQAAFPGYSALRALNLAICCVEMSEQDPWSESAALSVGISVGDAALVPTSRSTPLRFGQAVDNSLYLASQAGPHAIFVDLVAHDLLTEGDEPLPKGWRVGPMETLRSVDSQAVVGCHEIYFMSGPRGLRDQAAARSQRVRGTVQRWNGQHGFVVTNEDEFFYTDGRYLAGEAQPTTGQTVFFVPRANTSKQQQGRNARATALVGLGDWIEGQVVEERSDALFIRVRDESKNHQDLFSHRSEHQHPLQEGDAVVFEVGARSQRPVALNVRPLESEGSATLFADAPQGAPLANHFLFGLSEELRAAGHERLARSVLRLSANRRDTRTPTIEQANRQALLLTNHLLSHWLVRALSANDLYWLNVAATEHLGPIEDSVDASFAAESLRRYQDDPGLDGMTEMTLRHALKTLDFAGQLTREGYGRNAAESCAREAGKTLARAAAQGVVEAADVEATTVAAMLDRAT